MDKMGLENALMQIVFSFAEGFVLVTAFAIAYMLADFIKSSIDDPALKGITYTILGILVSVAILLPIHFTIGV